MKSASGKMWWINSKRKLLMGNFSSKTGRLLMMVSRRNNRLSFLLFAESTSASVSNSFPVREVALEDQISVSGKAENHKSRGSLRYVTLLCVDKDVPRIVVPDRPQPIMKMGLDIPGKGSLE